MKNNRDTCMRCVENGIEVHECICFSDEIIQQLDNFFTFQFRCPRCSYRWICSFRGEEK